MMMALAEKIFSQNTEEAKVIKVTEAGTMVATESNSLSSKDKAGCSISSTTKIGIENRKVTFPLHKFKSRKSSVF